MHIKKLDVIRAVSERGLPFTIQDFKQFAKIDGTDDDAVIEQLLYQVVNEVEQLIGRLLTPATVELVAVKQKGKTFFLPFMPTIAIGTTTLVNYTIVGDELDCDYDGEFSLTYTAGYTDVNRPDSLVLAIKMIAANVYENRGDTAAAEALAVAKKYLEPYNRNIITGFGI